METFFSTSLSSKNIVFHDFITMMEQNNMGLVFPFLPTVQLAGKAQATKRTGIELSYTVSLESKYQVSIFFHS